jgi:hypothetical protein
MKIIQDFMKIYMYELEKFLYTKKDELQKISFQSDEANTDRPLKEFLKQMIETTFFMIPENTTISSLECEGVEGTDIDLLKTIRINRVLLPEDITNDIHEIIKESKHAVYTNPDMCLEITYDNHIYYETIELKSTKKDAIPGSSVQQILPNEWVIFIKHFKDEIDVTTGQYIHAINSKMQFPDRSPRPQVSFKEIRNWNQINRVLSYSSLIYKKDDEVQEKYNLLNDWQSVLAKRWVNILFDDTTSTGTNEPWFNNNLRKFILAFLEKYEALTDDEKNFFKIHIQELIQ